MKKIKKNKNIIVIMSVFILGIAFHYFYGSFSKSLEVLPDEIRYYSIAKSLFYGDGFAFRGLPSDYQKFGYMFVLFPFFAIKSGVLRVKLITLANAILMMLTVFPLWGIMNRFDLAFKKKTIILFLFIVLPDIMFSATFMAEVLFWPISVLVVYLWMVNREKKSYLIAILLGVLCYFGYATKEVFLTLLLSIVGFELLYPCIEFLFFKKDINSKIKTYFSIKGLGNAAVTFIVFVIIHIVLKLTIFKGMGNSYNQMGFLEVANIKSLLYLIYGMAYYIVATLVCMCIIPILIPLFSARTLEKNVKEAYFFNILEFVLLVGTVGYTITVREDFGEIIPRLHFRYFGPVFAMFFLIFLVCLEKDFYKIKIRDYVILTIVNIIVFAMFRGVRVVTGVDQFVLDWVYLSTQKFGDIVGVILIDILIIVLEIMFLLLINYSKKLIVSYVTYIVAFFICIINTVTAKDRIYEYMYRKEALVNSVVNINKYFSEKDSSILYLASYENYGDKCKCMDTYMDKNKDLYYTSWQFAENMKEENNVTEIRIPMQFNLWNMSYENLEKIDYIIVENNQESKGKSFENVSKIEELSDEFFTVYVNNDISKLYIR